MTKPCYEEPESELTRLRAEWYSPAQYSDLRQKAESARRDYEAAHKLWRDEEQKLARVRGLLQRIHEAAESKSKGNRAPATLTLAKTIMELAKGEK